MSGSGAVDATPPPSSSPTAALWALRDRRTPAVAAASALTGLAPVLLRDAAYISLAASDEISRLLASMSDRVRTLPMTLGNVLEHCVHSVRGPIVWSETITARANAHGNDDVFVCRTARRSFDRTENQALVWVLSEVGAASRATRGPMSAMMEPGSCRRIEETAMRARAWRHHSRLVAVSPRRPHERDLARMRHVRRPERLADLLAAGRRVHQPFDSADLDGLTDPRTAAAHVEVAKVFELAILVLGLPRAAELRGGALRCGPVSYRHPEAPGSSPAGLTIDGRPVSDPPAQLAALVAAELDS